MKFTALKISGAKISALTMSGLVLGFSSYLAYLCYLFRERKWKIHTQTSNRNSTLWLLNIAAPHDKSQPCTT